MDSFIAHQKQFKKKEEKGILSPTKNILNKEEKVSPHKNI